MAKKKYKRTAKTTKPEIIFPVIEGDDHIKLIWDYDENTDMIHIKYNNHVLYSESVIYEGCNRYIYLGNLLKSQYGKRLIELSPTKISEYYLYGDDWFAIDSIESFKKSLLQ